jgi:glycosyltransferase involved in cell wall biosynthesis
MYNLGVISDYVFTHTDTMTKSAEKLLNRKIINHGFGVDMYDMAPFGATIDLCNKRNFTFGFLGNIRPYKDLEALIGAFQSARRLHPEIELLLVGPDYKMQGRYDKFCGDESGIKMYNNFVSDLTQLATFVDIFVCTYKIDLKQFQYGFFPSSIANIGCYGKAIICPQCSSVEDIIGNKLNAFVYDYFKRGALESTMEQVILADRKRLHRTGNLLKLHLVDNTWHRVVEKIIHTID